MDNLEKIPFDKIPEFALGASMVTAIGYILLQLLRAYRNIGGGYEKLDRAKDKEIARLEEQLKRKQRRRK